MEEDYKSPPAKKVFEFEGKVVEKHFGDIVKKVDSQGNETTSQNPTPEAIEAAQTSCFKWITTKKPEINLATAYETGFLAGVEFGDAQGYARAKSEMASHNGDSFKEWWCQRKSICRYWDQKSEEDKHLTTWFHALSYATGVKDEIAQLKQEIATITQKGERLCCAHGNTLMEVAQLKQEVEQAKGNLDIYKRSMVSAKTEWDAEIAQLKQVNTALVEALRYYSDDNGCGCAAGCRHCELAAKAIDAARRGKS